MFFSVISVVKINREERGGRGDFLFFSVLSVRSAVEINQGGHGVFLHNFVIFVVILQMVFVCLTKFY